MTDPSMADIACIEPLNLERMTQIIEKESLNAILPNLGGQSALNLSCELAQVGIPAKFGVKVIGLEISKC